MTAIEKAVYYTHRAQRKIQATMGSRWVRRQRERAGSRSKSLSTVASGRRTGQGSVGRAGLKEGRLQKHKDGFHLSGAWL